MHATYRTWVLVGPNHIKMTIIDAVNLYNMLNTCKTGFGIGIDGSSSNTGIGIMSEQEGLACTIACTRDSGKKKEDAVEYKLALKKEIEAILLNCKDHIKYIWYEEPFIGYAESSSVLMMIRSTVKEILVEHKDILGDIKYTEVNNKRWKKIFLESRNSRLPSNKGTFNSLSEAEKAAVAAVLSPKLVNDNLYDLTCSVTQDEFDACGIVSAGFYALRNNLSLESQKAVHKFKYETVFELYDLTPEETEEDIVQSLDETVGQYNIPSRVVENGITIRQLNGRKLFSNIVYETMGEDDKLLILVYRADKYANVLLTDCTQQDIIDNIRPNTIQTMVVYVWRKNRKA